MPNKPPPRLELLHPEPKPDPRDVCTTCGQPIDVESPIWIRIGAGVDAGVAHAEGGCS